jgi:uncharacterized protein YchJ
MSDKFFFNGRQDSRQDSAGGAYQTNAGSNGGSEKYPLVTVIVDKTPTRNDPCSCGSGKKFKKCCG